MYDNNEHKVAILIGVICDKSKINPDRLKSEKTYTVWSGLKR